MDCTIDTVELWVSDLERTSERLWTYGFSPVSTIFSSPSDERVTALTSGGVAVVVRQAMAPSSAMDAHVLAHGDTVGDVSLISRDADRIVRQARTHGLRTSEVLNGSRIDFSGSGTLCHTVRTTSVVDRRGSVSQGPFTRVDHVAYCLEPGTIPRVAEAYEAVLGLHRIQVPGGDEVGGAENGMRSVALTSGAAGLTIVLTEPTRRGGTGQVQQFLDNHVGPGVQHAALACESLVDSVAWCRARGAEFLSIPESYYDEGPSRLPGVDLPWEVLRELQILVDGEDNGLLLQLFGLSIADRSTFFLELIQRAGASGFGGNNVAALFAAVQSALATSGDPSGLEPQ